MSKIALKQQNCKSCGYCINACKQNALYRSDETNANGYHIIAVHEEKCVGCGMCYTVCPDYVFQIMEGGEKA